MNTSPGTVFTLSIPSDTMRWRQKRRIPRTGINDVPKTLSVCNPRCDSRCCRLTCCAPETGYIFKYPELRNRNDDEKWSIRQTGVLCKIGVVGNATSKWILLHPKYNSEGHESLKVVLNAKGEAAAELVHDPMLVNVHLLSTYLTNWRTYMFDIEEELIKLVSSRKQAIPTRLGAKSS
jgi:hypothetical protein